MVTALFKEGQKAATTTSLQKYDYGEVLRIKGLSLPRYVAVQFAVDGMSEALPSSIGETVEDVTDVLIPNSLLRSNIKPWNYNIMAYVYIVSGNSGKTEYTITIPVKWRPKTGDDQAADDDVAAVIGTAVEKMNTATQKAEAAANQAAETAAEISVDREQIQTNATDISSLKGDIKDKLGKTIKGNNLFADSSVTKGYYVSSTGNTGASINRGAATKYANICIDVIEGEKYQIETLVVGLSYDNLGVVIFADTNNKTVSGGLTLNKTTETYSSINNPVMFVVPQNAVKMYVTAYNESGWITAFNNDIFVRKITEIKGTVQSEIEGLKEITSNLNEDKLDKMQGIDNQGKYMQVGADGNILPVDIVMPSDSLDLVPGIAMSAEYMYSQSYAKDYFRRYVYSIIFEKQLKSSVVVADSNDLAAHDSNMVIVDGIAYIVYCGSLVEGTVDNAGGNNAFVRLIKWDVDNSTHLSSEVFAKHGDSIGGYTVTRGCGQPNITKVSDDTLRVTFSAYINYNSLEICCICYKDYTMSTGTTNNSGVCTLDGKPINLYYVAQNYDCLAIGYENYYAEGRRLSQMQMNATIAYSNGYYYACPLSGSLMTAIALKSTDLITWEYVSMIPYKFATAYEGACCVDGDYLYMAFRTGGSGTSSFSGGQIGTYDAFGVTGLSMNGYTNGMPIYKYNLSANKFVDVAVLPDASCRPEFFVKNNNIYLMHGGWSGRASGYISQINKQKLNLTSIIRETRNAGNYQYLSVAEHGGKTYCCMSKNKIEFAQFDVDNYINVEEKFATLLGV